MTCSACGCPVLTLTLPLAELADGSVMSEVVEFCATCDEELR